MLNTGTYRTNGVIPAGPITFRFVADLLPMDDTMVLLKMPGSAPSVATVIVGRLCNFRDN